ncbi:MAG: orotidine-5'-phosphate decarboxylase [Candidatus Thermoplasmatota archaeon]|nr:orotidine-5'-phosphate decarboxylase [Candidatus Thermoplasmatota archaeon]
MKRLILALDLEERGAALDLAELLKEEIAAIKVNYPLVLSTGMEIVKELSEIRPVICDFKVADIPYTNGKIARIAYENGAKAIICHGFMGKKSIEACSSVLATIVVAEMSNEGSRDFFEKYSQRIVELAIDAKATGLIAPATKAERISQIKKLAPELKILSPGVGAQGGKASDAIRNGADFVIVGRAIYNSNDPVTIAKKINGEIESTLTSA